MSGKRRYYAYIPFNRRGCLFDDCMTESIPGEKPHVAGRLIIYQSAKRMSLPVIFHHCLTKAEKDDFRYPQHCTREDAERVFGRRVFKEKIEDARFSDEIHVF